MKELGTYTSHDAKIAQERQSLNKLSSLVKGQEAITQATGGSQEAQANANSLFIANGGEAVPFRTNLEGTWVGDKFIPSGTNFSQIPSKGDAEFPTDVESITEGTAEAAVTKPPPSNVFTRHYKTGNILGVMTRAQRRAYEKEAAGKVYEGKRTQFMIGNKDYGG
jgi:hypothetical protein